MAVTRFQRKEKKLKTRARIRKQTLKRLNKKPAIKNVDVEELKKSFSTSGSAKGKTESTNGSEKEEKSTKSSEDLAPEKKPDAESKNEG